MEVPNAIAEAAIQVATAVNADAILIQTETGSNCHWLIDKLDVQPGRPIKLIVATSSHECSSRLGKRQDVAIVKVPAWQAGRMARAGQLVSHSLHQGHISEGQRLVCLLGDGCPDFTDLIKVWDVTGEEYATDILSNPTVASVVELAIELASIRQEGKLLGTAFLVGDSKSVLRLSYQMMIDPFQNHRASINDRKQWELVKKYAAFDGAFIIDSDGRIVAAHRFLNSNQRCDIPPGLGTRHNAVAAMTSSTAAKGVTVSQEDGLVRIFEGGKVAAKISPSSRIVECFKESK